MEQGRGDGLLGRRGFLTGAAAMLVLTAGPARADVRRALSIRNAHTGESFSGVYRDSEGPRPEAMTAVARLMRDQRTGTVHPIDPALLDILAAIADRISGRITGGDGAAPAFTLLSGYRSPQTNAMLRRTSLWVARDSLHMQGRAVDIRVPGVDAAVLRDIALALGRGGVGYYPAAGFVHIDSGRFRAIDPAQRDLDLLTSRLSGRHTAAPTLGGLSLGGPTPGPSLSGLSLGGP